MTDKEIIRAKITGEIEKLQEELHFADAESDVARNIVRAIKTLEPILAFIDSLHKAPCLRYWEGWGCDISPQKRCDGCIQYVPRAEQENKKED
jgi:hypothetical protein